MNDDKTVYLYEHTSDGVERIVFSGSTIEVLKHIAKVSNTFGRPFYRHWIADGRYMYDCGDITLFTTVSLDPEGDKKLK